MTEIAERIDNTSEKLARAKALAREKGMGIATAANEAGAKGMTAVGNAVGRVAERSPLQDESKIVQGMNGAASYLRDKDPRGFLGDVDGSIHAHPYRTLLVGMGLGGLITYIATRD